MFVKITRAGNYWLNPNQIIRQNKLIGYTANWLADNPLMPRENLWEIHGENVLNAFAVLNPSDFGNITYATEEYVDPVTGDIGERSFIVEWRQYLKAIVVSEALSKNVFTKLQIRRALRELNKETVLDSLLTSNPQFAADWYDALEIDLADPMTAAALELVEIDINAVKLKIAGIE